MPADRPGDRPVPDLGRGPGQPGHAGYARRRRSEGHRLRGGLLLGRHEPRDHEAAARAGALHVGRRLLVEQLQLLHQPVDPQPPAGDPSWQGHEPGDGAVYNCYQPQTGMLIYDLVAGPAARTRAPGRRRARSPRSRSSRWTSRPSTSASRPSPGPDSIGLVGMPVWMWAKAPERPHLRADHRERVGRRDHDHRDREGPAGVTWDMGDGTEVVCNTAGTPYKPAYGRKDSPDCGHTYKKSSAHEPGRGLHGHRHVELGHHLVGRRSDRDDPPRRPEPLDPDPDRRGAGARELTSRAGRYDDDHDCPRGPDSPARASPRRNRPAVTPPPKLRRRPALVVAAVVVDRASAACSARGRGARRPTPRRSSPRAHTIHRGEVITGRRHPAGPDQRRPGAPARCLLRRTTASSASAPPSTSPPAGCSHASRRADCADAAAGPVGRRDLADSGAGAGDCRCTAATRSGSSSRPATTATRRRRTAVHRRRGRRHRVRRDHRQHRRQRPGAVRRRGRPRRPRGDRATSPSSWTPEAQ